MVDASLLRQRPLSIPLERWFILHALPFAVANWKDTAMGRAPNSAITFWYTEYQQIRKLCADITDSSDWSKAVPLPLSTARTEHTQAAAEAANGVRAAVCGK